MTEKTPLTTQNSEDMMTHLTKIGLLLSAEKDIHHLLQMMLQESLALTHSDAGSIFLRLQEDEQDLLEFTYTENFSRHIPFNRFKMPVSKESIAGSVCLSGESLMINDMTHLPQILGIQHNDAFDRKYAYRSCNMLVIPLKNIDDEVLGVMQLINKKKNVSEALTEPNHIPMQIVPYTQEERKIIATVASQAAILLERMRLYEEINAIFESLIETMVETIDQRDPVTAGHSIRVAKYAKAFAEALNDINQGPYKDVSFDEHGLKEIYYAGLLHDVGKIGVREYVLLKQNKLSDAQMEALQYKLYFARAYYKTCFPMTQVESTFLSEFDSIFQRLLSINTGGFLESEDEALLSSLKSLSFIDPHGEKKPLLSTLEYENLSVKRGNLTAEERKMIQAHAGFTGEIVEKIPWGKHLKNVPELASNHHEKLDGSGYPKGFCQEDLSLGSRIMTIVDIFDALTARDRPYKPALSVEKSLSILFEDAKRGALDLSLVQIFAEKKPFKAILEGEANQ